MTRSVIGLHVRTLTVRESSGNKGLAISPDGTRMVVSNFNTRRIAVYSLPDCVLQAEFGGVGSAPGQFVNPDKICFPPHDSNRVLISDCLNQRIQVRLHLHGLDCTFDW